MLEHQQLCNLWESSLGKHESVKHTIYTTMLEVIPHLSLEMIDQLFEQVYLYLSLIPLDEKERCNGTRFRDNRVCFSIYKNSTFKGWK